MMVALFARIPGAQAALSASSSTLGADQIALQAVSQQPIAEQLPVSTRSVRAACGHRP